MTDKEPDVTLGHIVMDLLLFFSGFVCLCDAKKEIEKQCGIKKKPKCMCWSDDDIIKAWKKTKKEKINSKKRKHWARVIMFRIIRSVFCDECKQNTAQKNRHGTTDEQDCEMRRNPEDRSSQSKAELERVGAAGEDEQRIQKVTEGTKLLEDSAAASASRLSASSTDESERSKNGLWSTVKQALSKSLKMNEKDRSSQSQTLVQTCSPFSKRKHKDTLFFSDDQSGIDDNAGSKEETKRFKEHKPIFIRIPFSKMFQSEAIKAHKLPKKTDQRKVSKYKLIDLPPQDDNTEADETIDEKGKSRFYVMSYNSETKTPKWVYEILNISTLPSYYKKPEFKYSDSDSDSGDPSYEPTKRSKPYDNPDYDRGHLAPAANHTWCQEAYEETYSMRNVTPQNKTLNRGLWKKLEEYCRNKVLLDDVHNVHVYTGPIYLNKELMVDRTAVPYEYFKVIIVEKVGGEVELECYKMPNKNPESEEQEKPKSEEQDKNLKKKTRRNSEANNAWLIKYEADIKYIEEKTGLKFTEECCELDGVDQKKSGQWLGNKGKKSVTIDVTISSCEKNDPLRNEE